VNEIVHEQIDALHPIPSVPQRSRAPIFMRP
jgi:hypothetical protein